MKINIAFIILPLITKSLLEKSESDFYNAYWERFSSILKRDLLSKRFSRFNESQNLNAQPAYDICELPLWIASLYPILKTIIQKSIVIDLFDLSASIINYNEIEKRISAEKANIYLISPLLLNIDVAFNVAKIIKQLYGNSVKVIIGGPFATYEDIFVSSCNYVDVVYRGRANESLSELVLSIIKNENLKNFSGITWVEDEKLHRNNIQQSQFQITYDYKIIPSEYSGRIPWARLFCSSGCLWNCAYCADVIWNRTKPQYREVSSVIHEAIQIAQLFDVDTFYIGDETFTYNTRFVEEFSAGMNASGLQWICQTRVDCITASLIKKMANGNCRMIKFGAESSNQFIINNIRKGIRVDQISESCRMVKDANLNSFTYWLVGLPGETEETANNTISYIENLFNNKLCDLLEWFICVPYPGTDLYENPDKYKIKIHNLPWSKWREDSPSVVSTENLPSTEIYNLWIKGLNRYVDLLKNKL